MFDSVHIGAIEALWIVVNALGVGTAVFGLVDAWQLRDLDGSAQREITAWGNVRREAARLIAQSLLLSVIWPGVFSDREIVLTLPIAALIAVPIILTANSLLDMVERRRVRDLNEADIRAAVVEGVERLEVAVAEVGKDAKAAYAEANAVNQKIDARTKAIAEGEEVP